MATQLRAESKSTVTQITTGCNQGLQKILDPWSRCTTAAEDNIRCCSCQLSPGNWGYSSQVSSKLVVWGIFSHFVLLSTKGALVKLNSQPEYCRWPRPTLLIKDSKRSVFRFTTSDPLRLAQMASTVTWPPHLWGCAGTADSHHCVILSCCYEPKSQRRHEAWRATLKGNQPNPALEDVANKVSGVWDQKTQNLAGMRSQQISFPLETIKFPLNVRTNIKSVMGMFSVPELL